MTTSESAPDPTAGERWECGPHTNAWGGHDARCRKVPATPADPTAGEGPCPDCGEKRSAHAVVSVCPATPDADDASERVTTLLHSYDRSTGMCRCGDGPLAPASWVAHYKAQDQPAITTEGAYHLTEDVSATPDADDASTEASGRLTEAEREAIWQAIWQTLADHQWEAWECSCGGVRKDSGEYEDNHLADVLADLFAAREADAATKARADERKRIAQAIEADCPGDPLSGSTRACGPCRKAARIARDGGR